MEMLSGMFMLVQVKLATCSCDSAKCSRDATFLQKTAQAEA